MHINTSHATMLECKFEKNGSPFNHMFPAEEAKYADVFLKPLLQYAPTSTEKPKRMPKN